jgi:hypothetical protein
MMINDLKQPWKTGKKKDIFNNFLMVPGSMSLKPET